uniref:Ig-like domain-containing protein n=1 Tax=Xiphophorus maculatus TaxID=8083 RepID=A0A3B5Q562_XIPMA
SYFFKPYVIIFLHFHVFQQMYGCEWDEETGEVKGYDQFGYDGEDLITLDPKTQEWIAPKPQAVITKHKWDNNRAAWLKKYVNYGRRSLMKTGIKNVKNFVYLYKETKNVFLYILHCFATGFYPNKTEMFWRKDGEEIHDDVEKGEILPNNDGTFQMSIYLDLSSVPPEDWTRYECVFQFTGVREVNSTFMLIIIIVSVINFEFIMTGFILCHMIKTGQKSVVFLS